MADIVERLRWPVENDPLVAEVGYDEELTEAAEEIGLLPGGEPPT